MRALYGQVCEVMSVFSKHIFQSVIDPLLGKRVGLVNFALDVADQFSIEATRKLLNALHVDYSNLSRADIRAGKLGGDIQEIIVSGSGAIATQNTRFKETKSLLMQSRIPITLLPLPGIQFKEVLNGFSKVYVSTQLDKQRFPDSLLAPPCFLGYPEPIPDCGIEYDTGVYLSKSYFGFGQYQELSLADPMEVCKSTMDIFAIASKFETVVTNQLFLCVASILLGRKTVLLAPPDSYTYSFYQTWLSEYCECRCGIGQIQDDTELLRNSLYQTLCQRPGGISSWSDMPFRENGYILGEFGDGVRLINADGIRLGVPNESAQIVWQLCDGNTPIDEMVDLLYEAYSVSKVDIANDVLKAISTFQSMGAVGVRAGAEINGSGNPQNLSFTGAKNLQLAIEQKKIVGDEQVWRASLEGGPWEKPCNFWLSVPLRDLEFDCELADPFVLLSVGIAMRLGKDLDIIGAPVSYDLIENLWNFQQAWALWRRAYQRVHIQAEEVHSVRAGDSNIATFSGGVDSCYTIYQSVVADAIPFSPTISSIVTIHGFDISLSDQRSFDQAVSNNRKLLKGLNLGLIRVKTNAKEFVNNWLDDHGLILGAVLNLFSGNFGGGIISGTLPYNQLYPLGSNVVTDRLMGRKGFDIQHFGSGATRVDKIKALKNWPAVDKYLRVCWQKFISENNCGECKKCITTAIIYDLFNSNPQCLQGSLDTHTLSKMLENESLGRLDWYDLNCVVEEATRLQLDKWWLPQLKAAVLKYG